MLGFGLSSIVVEMPEGCPCRLSSKCLCSSVHRAAACPAVSELQASLLLRMPLLLAGGGARSSKDLRARGIAFADTRTR